MKTLWEAAEYMQSLLPNTTVQIDLLDGYLIYYAIPLCVKDKVSPNFFTFSPEIQERYLKGTVNVVKELFKCAINEATQELNALRTEVESW